MPRRPTQLRRATSPLAGVPVFVARQPIYDRALSVDSFELLYRARGGSAFEGLDGTRATAQVLAEGLLAHGPEALTGGRLAYVNCTRELLLSGSIRVLPPSFLAVEVLESVPASRPVLDACGALRDDGYRVALDDVHSIDRVRKFGDVIDLVKVDFRLVQPARLPRLVDDIRSVAPAVTLLAEKVEDWDDLELARSLGFDLFQGFFLGKPQMLERRTVPGFKPHYLRLLEATQREDLDIDTLESLVKADLSLTHKLIRQANSVAMGQVRRLTSLREVLVLLGVEEVRRAAALVVLAGLGADRPQQLAIDSAVRAHFCEALPLEDSAPFDRFLAGMFSMLDAILGLPMEQAVQSMPLPEAVVDALVRHCGPLHPALALVERYASGDWDAAQGIACALGVDEACLSRHYLDAVAWGEEVFELGHIAA